MQKTSSHAAPHRQRSSAQSQSQIQTQARSGWAPRVWVGGVVVAVAALSVITALKPDQWPALGLISFVPFPVYLLPTLLAVLLSLRLGWLWRAGAMLSLVLCLVVLMGLSWGQADSGHGELRFMTYNVKAYLALRKPGGLAELAQEFNEQQPDILVMQDAGLLGPVDTHPRPRILDMMRVPYLFAGDQFVVVSRWPLDQCHLITLSHDRPLDYNFVHCVIQVQGVTLNVVTVHLVTPRDGLNATRSSGLEGLKAWQENLEWRLEQSGKLAEYLRHVPRPLIVAGDLNAPESTVVVQTLLHTGLRDAYSSSALGWGYTHGHSLIPGLSFLRIDHILVSAELGVLDTTVGGRMASQHRPVIATLLLHRT